MADSCYYCEKEIATDEYGYDYNLIQITGVKSKFDYDYSIKWVMVPRCKSCVKIHDRFWIAVFILTFVLVIVILFWSKIYEFNLEDIIYGIAFSFMAGAGAAKFLSRQIFTRLFKMKPEGNVDDYPPIRQLLDLGYIKKPPRKGATENDIARDVEQ